MTNDRISLDQAYDNSDVIAQILDLRDQDAEFAEQIEQALDGKQDTLISGTNIKTVNGESILGSGDLDVSVEVDSALSTASENPVENRVITNALNDKQDALSTAQLNAVNSGITGAKVSTYDGYATNKQNTLSATQLNAVNSGITGAKVSTYDGYAAQILAKQDLLVSSTNIKTINGESILGSGNIDIQGGGSVTVDSALSTTSENPVQNKVIASALNGKQNTLSATQLNAVNSGITGVKVSTYDGYASGKQDVLSTAQMNAANSGITAAKVSTYDGYATNKQNTLSATQLNAANSGITAAKVSTYDGYASQISAKQNAIQTAQITVPAAGGTVTVTGMTATAFVIVSPDPSSFDVYATAGCRCTAQAANALTFAVDETASAAMTVNVGWFA